MGQGGTIPAVLSPKKSLLHPLHLKTDWVLRADSYWGIWVVVLWAQKGDNGNLWSGTKNILCPQVGWTPGSSRMLGSSSRLLPQWGVGWEGLSR